jgi:hypothetical protein
MADSAAYTAAEVNFRRTRRDTKPIRFRFKQGGVPIDNTGYTYKLEGSLIPDPVDQSQHQFELTASGSGATGLAVFVPTADDMDPEESPGVNATVVFYTLRETVAGATFTSAKGRIDFDPSIVDPEV